VQPPLAMHRIYHLGGCLAGLLQCPVIFQLTRCEGHQIYHLGPVPQPTRSTQDYASDTFLKVPDTHLSPGARPTRCKANDIYCRHTRTGTRLSQIPVLGHALQRHLIYSGPYTPEWYWIYHLGVARRHAAKHWIILGRHAVKATQIYQPGAGAHLLRSTQDYASDSMFLRVPIFT